MTWLARLKKTAIAPDAHPTEPAKPGSVGFVGTPLALNQNSGGEPGAANEPAHAQDFDREAFDERAAILEFDGGMSRAEAEALAAAGGVLASDPDRYCWPHSAAMNTVEIDTFNGRLHLFTRRGLDYTDAERLADRLVIRDREGDDRRLCLECARLDMRGRCQSARLGVIAGAGRELEPVNTILQRCEGFTI